MILEALPKRRIPVTQVINQFDGSISRSMLIVANTWFGTCSVAIRRNWNVDSIQLENQLKHVIGEVPTRMDPEKYDMAVNRVIGLSYEDDWKVLGVIKDNPIGVPIVVLQKGDEYTALPYKWFKWLTDQGNVVRGINKFFPFVFIDKYNGVVNGVINPFLPEALDDFLPQVIIDKTAVENLFSTLITKVV